jgi:hypothetical protein
MAGPVEWCSPDNHTCSFVSQLLVESVRRDEALRLASGSRNAGLVAAVSDLELIIMAAPDMSLAHDGMSPQRISDNSRRGSFGFWRMTGTGWVGAML